MALSTSKAFINDICMRLDYFCRSSHHGVSNGILIWFETPIALDKMHPFRRVLAPLFCRNEWCIDTEGRGVIFFISMAVYCS